MVVIKGMKVTLVGVILAAGPSLALARLMKCTLYGVKSWDPLTIIFVTILLSAVSLLAAYLPARRASRVDPMVELRYEQPTRLLFTCRSSIASAWRVPNERLDRFTANLAYG